MKNLVFICFSLIIVACSNSAKEEIQIGYLNPNLEIKDLNQWKSTSNSNDSIWVNIVDSDLKTTTNISNVLFKINRLPIQSLNKVKNEYYNLKNQLKRIKDKIITADQVKISGGEGIYELFVFEPLNKDILADVQWIKLNSLDQYEKLSWDGWYQAGEHGLAFSVELESLKDCLIVVTAPYSMEAYDDFDANYKGRKIPMLNSESTDTIWKLTDDLGITLIDELKSTDNINIIQSYLTGSRIDLPKKYRASDSFLEQNTQYIYLTYNTLTVNKFDKEQEMARTAYNNEIARLKENVKSPACMCAEVLASPENFDSEIKLKCIRMYKCFNNAYVDCSTKSEHIWTECN